MKFILNILLILLVVSTIFVCTAKPDMHKTVMVYDSAYKLVHENITESEKKEIPVMEITVKPQETVTNVEKQTYQKPVTNNTTVNVQKIPQKIQKTQTVTPVQKTTTQKKENTIVQKAEQPKVQTQKQETVAKVETPKVTTVVTPEKPKVLTQQEETIAWNMWRSNLQNQIMQDVKLPLLPNGIVFRFTFTVDKYGKISNLQTWSDTSAYTPYAIQYIAPVIRSYQGRSILHFPEGTARVVTDVKGGWKISDNIRYSSPQDYNDVEKVIK